MKPLIAGLIGFALGLACLPLVAMALGWTRGGAMQAAVGPRGAEPKPDAADSTAPESAQRPVSSNPLSASTETLTAGLRLYRDNCAGCHGTPGRPSRWGTRGFRPPAPQFGDRPPRLRDAEMFAIIKDGIENSGMAGWEVLLADADIWRVTTFLRHLRDLPEPARAAWKGKPPA